MCKIFVHFWVELKPMLVNTFCFCKKYESYAQTLSRMRSNNVHFILYLINNPSSYIGDAQKYFHILSCWHCLSISILGFCPRHELPCFFFWILKSNPIWFICMYIKRFSQSSATSKDAWKFSCNYFIQCSFVQELQSFV
jgi:hypothetical protein